MEEYDILKKELHHVDSNKANPKKFHLLKKDFFFKT